MNEQVVDGDLFGKGAFRDLLGPKANPKTHSDSNSDGAHHTQQKDDEAAHTTALLDQAWPRVAAARDTRGSDRNLLGSTE